MFANKVFTFVMKTVVLDVSITKVGFEPQITLDMDLAWYKESLHKAMPFSVDFDRDHTDTYVYSGGFDRVVNTYLPKKNKIARSINLDKEFSKASDKYLKV